MTPELVEVTEQFMAPSLMYPHGSYRIKVGNDVIFGTGLWRTPNATEDYSWRATIMWQIHEMSRFTIEHPWPWMRPCRALVKEGPKAMVLVR